MNESISEPINNNYSNENNSVEEENPLALIANDLFNSGPESQQLSLIGQDRSKGVRKRKSTCKKSKKSKRFAKDESLYNNSEENMVGKIGANLFASTLAKVYLVNLHIF